MRPAAGTLTMGGQDVSSIIIGPSQGAVTHVLGGALGVGRRGNYMMESAKWSRAKGRCVQSVPGALLFLAIDEAHYQES